MKKIFTLLFLIGVLSIANAQSTAAIIDSTVCYSFSSPTDSIPITLTINHYDANDNQILIVSYNWDSIYNDFIGYTEYDWIGNKKEEYMYDSNNNIILYLTYIWDKSINNWVGEYEKNEYKYDSNNNKILEVDFIWYDNDIKWRESRKREYEYDSNNNVTLYIYSIWDSNINDWTSFSNVKYEYIYNSSNNLILRLSDSWYVDSTGLKKSKDEYFYDANNNKTLEMHYRWDINNYKWVESIKNESKYDSNNNKILEIEFIWDGYLNKWIGNRKEENEYDSNNNKTLYIYYFGSMGTGINDTACVWEVYEKQEYSYDANNNMILYEQTIQSHNFGKYEYIYDINNNLLSVVHYGFGYFTEYIYDSNNKIESETTYLWDSNINDWVISNKCNDLYSAISEQTTQEIGISPNPTTGRVLIDNNSLEKVEVYNISGKLILTTDKKEIDLSNNAKGTYLFRVTIDNFIYTQKIILE